MDPATGRADSSPPSTFSSAVVACSPDVTEDVSFSLASKGGDVGRLSKGGDGKASGASVVSPSESFFPRGGMSFPPEGETTFLPPNKTVHSSSPTANLPLILSGYSATTFAGLTSSSLNILIAFSNWAVRKREEACRARMRVSFVVCVHALVLNMEEREGEGKRSTLSLTTPSSKDSNNVKASPYSPSSVNLSTCSTHGKRGNFQTVLPSLAAIVRSVGVDTANRHGVLEEEEGVRRRSVAAATGAVLCTVVVVVAAAVVVV